jgi:hypothetical protein
MSNGGGGSGGERRSQECLGTFQAPSSSRQGLDILGIFAGVHAKIFFERSVAGCATRRTPLGWMLHGHGKNSRKIEPQDIAGSLPPGRYGDGGNLHLIVDSAGAKRWMFIFRWQGRQREMRLGGLRDVSFAKVRERAAAARSELADGRNPLEQKREAQARPPFGEFAVEFLEAIRPGFSNPKHFAQWKMTLTTYAAPLKDKRLDQITTVDVVATLKPIWTRIPETADRTRQRIERVLDAMAAYVSASDRRVQSIAVRNLRAIGRLDFAGVDRGGRAPWLMLLGENASGKSTELQAVALALIGDRYRDRLTKRLSLDLRRMVRAGAPYGGDQRDLVRKQRAKAFAYLP